MSGDCIIPAGAAPSLQDVDWQPAYSHEDGNLIRLFFTPALSCAALYQRVTGYFSEGALVLAARGLDALIARGGRMELVVGCTLHPKEVEKIKEGYALREILTHALAEKLGLCAQRPEARERLGWLSWMVAGGYLDIKLAVPKDASTGKIQQGMGIYHAKAGILTDPHGNRIAFTGSINETEAGWASNCESFTVSCSWRGKWDLKRVEKARHDFYLLWNNTAKSAEVVEFPEALKKELLKYLPPDGCPVKKTSIISKSEKEAPPADAPPEPEVMLTPDERRRKVWAFLRHAPKRPDGVMIAVRTSTVVPWPHQLRAYKRMLDTWPFRLLIADEVGLGKTIEAGMIIRHAWISGLAKRICIMVPSGVIRQWQNELYEKFNLLVPAYTGRSFVWPEHYYRKRPLEEKVSRETWTSAPLVMVSSHLMRRADRQQELISADKWDLLVLDEAHHARRKGAGTAQEKGPNRLLALMQQMRTRTEALLLLTATPMQVHPVEIWDLLALLGLPPEWSAQTFVDYFEALNANPDDESLHRLAKLFQTAESAYGSIPDTEIRQIAEKHGLSTIKTRKLISALREPKTLIPIKHLSVGQRKAALAVLKAGSPVRFRMSRHTRNLLKAYYKKGMLDAPVAERVVSDLAIDMTPPERALYEAVEDYISNAYQMANPDAKNAVGFIMTVYRRRVASCFYALRRTLEKRMEKLANPPGEPEDLERLEEDLAHNDLADEVLSGEDAADFVQQSLGIEEERSIRYLLEQISTLETDSKALRLVKELEAEFASGYDSAIIFTQYTDTLDFLKEFLAQRLEMPIGCFSGAGGQYRDHAGAWQSCKKEEIKRYLMQGKIRLLICTDAAGEGLNLQYCGVLVNFDLPWNPMKVEQRIGRIDRIGQKNARIRILNLAYADTVEADVYFALSERIGLFNGIVGKLQPILARIPKEFETAVLAPADQRERARHDIVDAVRRMADETEAGGFDIDDISAADLAIPELPGPPYSPSDMETILNREDLLPPGIEIKPLDPGAYKLRVPGYTDYARVTPFPRIFDDHFESHQLLLPGSPLFQILCEKSGAWEELKMDIEDIQALIRK